MAYYYSSATWVAAHTAVKDLIATGAGDPKVQIKDAGSVLLAEILLDKATFSVNGTTGAITLPVKTQEDSANATGTAAVANILDGDGTFVCQLPCQQGTSPVSGYCVMNTLTVIQNASVDILSITIQPGPSAP